MKGWRRVFWQVRFLPSRSRALAGAGLATGTISLPSLESALRRYIVPTADQKSDSAGAAAPRRQGSDTYLALKHLRLYFRQGCRCLRLQSVAGRHTCCFYARPSPRACQRGLTGGGGVLRPLSGCSYGGAGWAVQGSTDHRGTPEAPGRTATLVQEPDTSVVVRRVCPDPPAALSSMVLRSAPGFSHRPALGPAIQTPWKSRCCMWRAAALLFQGCCIVLSHEIYAFPLVIKDTASVCDTSLIRHHPAQQTFICQELKISRKFALCCAVGRGVSTGGEPRGTAGSAQGAPGCPHCMERSQWFVHTCCSHTSSFCQHSH